MIKLPEKVLHFIWAHQLLNSNQLHTKEGERVTILYQGVGNPSNGPDFEKARVKIGGTLFAGSIEIHIFETDWFNHDHHIDPNYNSTVLHVCLYEGRSALRQDETLVPALILEPYVSQNLLSKYQELMQNHEQVACAPFIQDMSTLEYTHLIDHMLINKLSLGLGRLEHAFDVGNKDWHNAFYVILLRAFGLARNGQAFEELALSLPYAILLKHRHSLFQLEALLLGQAQLIPLLPLDTYSRSLKREYAFLKSKYGLKEISCKLKTGSIRPMSQVHNRLAQFASLINHHFNTVELLMQLRPPNELYKYFDQCVSDYWQTHSAFSQKANKQSKRLSAKFIDHIIINAVVPFKVYYDRCRHQFSGVDAAISYLRMLAAESNKVIKIWRRLNLNISSAAESQALLHLYKTYCNFRRCLDCPYGQNILTRNEAIKTNN